VDKAKVLQALQSKGESYDRARETLKHVSVDASGKVELEDWVEVRIDLDDVTGQGLNYFSAVECQVTG
jgi:plastin-1